MVLRHFFGGGGMWCNGTLSEVILRVFFETSQTPKRTTTLRIGVRVVCSGIYG